MCYHIETVSLIGKFIVCKKDLKIYVCVRHHITDPIDQAGICVRVLPLKDQSDLIFSV